MNKIKELVSSIPINIIIEKDFDLKESSGYYKGIEHDSLVIDKSKNVFFWNSLSIRGDSLDWLISVKGLTIEESVSYLFSLAKVSKLDRFYDKDSLYFNNDPISVYPKLLDIFFNLGKNHRKYWYSRGYTDETIDLFKLGWSGRCYVIPITYEGKLYNFQCRLPKQDDGKKKVWNWVKGTGALPFNFDVLKNTRSVIINESPVDCIMLTQNGFPAVSQTAGSGTWLAKWNSYFKNINDVVVIFDQDIAGTKSAIHTASNFKDRVRILIWPDGFPDKYDCNDFLKERSKQEFNRLLVDNTFNYEMAKMLSIIRVKNSWVN